MPIVNEGAGRMTHQGQHRLSRRKYQELIRFLKEVITNERASLKVRYSAACRLDDIYNRHEEAQGRLADREARELAEAGRLTGSQEDDASETTEPKESASTAAQRFLDSLKQKAGAEAGAEADNE